MDLNPSKYSLKSRNSAGHARKTQVADASSNDIPNSELGRAAKDVGSVIADCQNRVHQALTDWFNEANELEDALSQFKDNAESVTKQLRSMIKAYQKYPKHVSFTGPQNQRMLDMMSLLGVPPSQIQGGALNSKGNYYYKGSEYAHDIRIAMQYAAKDVQSFSGTVAGYKHQQTKDMFGVMSAFNGVKMNEESLTNLMQMLVSLTRGLMQNVT